jgi:hypothetical protein
MLERGRQVTARQLRITARRTPSHPFIRAFVGIAADEGHNRLIAEDHLSRKSIKRSIDA